MSTPGRIRQAQAWVWASANPSLNWWEGRWAWRVSLVRGLASSCCYKQIASTPRINRLNSGSRNSKVLKTWQQTKDRPLGSRTGSISILRNLSQLRTRLRISSHRYTSIPAISIIRTHTSSSINQIPWLFPYKKTRPKTFWKSRNREAGTLVLPQKDSLCLRGWYRWYKSREKTLPRIFWTCLSLSSRWLWVSKKTCTSSMWIPASFTCRLRRSTTLVTRW
jgi:hypothetical protein